MQGTSVTKLAKGLLSGVLSVTTAALLVPAGPTRAFAALDERGSKAAGGCHENQDDPARGGEANPAPQLAEPDEGMASSGDGRVSGVDIGGDAEGPGATPSKNASGDEAGDDGGEESVPDAEDAPGTEGLEFVGHAQLGDDELVSGTQGAPTCYESGRFRARLRASDGFDGVAVVEMDGGSQSLDVVPCEDEEEYELVGELPDGTIESLVLRVCSAQGASLELRYEHILIDSMPPTYDVRLDGESEGWLYDDVMYMAKACEMRVTVEERNPDEGLRLVCNGESLVPQLDESSMSYVLNLTHDGEYAIDLEGHDALGRAPVWSEDGMRLPLRVVVDTKPPVVRVRYDGEELRAQSLHGGRLYVQRRPRVVVEVVDDNLDETTLRVGGEVYDGWQRDDGVYRLELPADVPLDGAHLVSASDRAGNRVAETYVVPIVVDDAAPTIDVERLCPDVVVCEEERASLFFADETFIRLLVEDGCGIARVDVDGSEACDVMMGDFEPGDTSVAITLGLVEDIDPVQKIEVRVEDLAGNWRTWSLDKQGEVWDAGARRHVGNAPVCVNEHEQPVYPAVMLLDCTSPTLTIVGVQDGGAYDAPCEAIIRVDEANFSYVSRYAGDAFADQPVVWWALQNPKPGETAVSDHVALRVRDFRQNEASGCWEARLRFDRDGAYALRARLVDAAGNASQTLACAFTLDATAPVCEVKFLHDASHAEEREGAYYRTPRLAVVRLREHNWDDRRSLDLRYVTEDGEVHPIDAAKFESVGEDWYECRVEFRKDDAYQLFVDVVDVAGNKMAPYATEPFVIDTTNPAIRVSYTGGDPHSGSYYAGARVATITVTEHNWGSDDHFGVDVEIRDASPGYAPERSGWSQPNAAKPDEHVLTVRCGKDGRYTLRVRGRDLAGREALGAGSIGFEDSFVIDAEAPEVEVSFHPSSYVEFGGVKYLRDVLEVPVVVRDRNLDASKARLTCDLLDAAGDDRIAWVVENPDAEGRIARRKTLRFGHGRHVSPTIDVVDLAENATRVEGEGFVVDLRAPLIQRVSTSVLPAAVHEGEMGGQRGEVQFFDQATQVVFDVADEFGIEGASLYDPDGEYDLAEEVERGCTQARVTVQLAESSDSHASDAFERNIVFTVVDIAGNRRSWTLDRKGEVVAQEAWEDGAPMLNGSGEPVALVQDGVSPMVAIDGVESGSMSSQTQVARVSVMESNFSYLQTFRPQDVVVRVTSRDALPEGARRQDEVIAAQFDGSDPLWSYEREFATDGHYSLEASIVDIAGHESNHVEIGEFCVDKTPPKITVTWDHDLDEAHAVGGTYYFKTLREATVAVHEHNFRPDDYVVDAGGIGVVSSWRDAGGDTHMCTVSYAQEAKNCHLAVRGRDPAGNDAQGYEQAHFTIDLTPPTAQVLNVTGPRGERAFAGEVVPALAFGDGDDGNFDAGPKGWTYRMEGVRLANEASRFDLERFGQREETTSDGATVLFGDLGKRPSEEGAYDVSFDDVYTITASACDLAGNQSTPVRATFSVNRFGSNFFVEDANDLGTGVGSLAERIDGTRLLPDAPTIVVHEVNVSGALSEADHSVIRDYANMPEELTQDAEGRASADGDAGYSLRALSEPNAFNEYAGWAEYVYTIRSGNFGRGAVEVGDGQGLYRVNVGSVDAASNVNSTSRYWASDRERNVAADKSATVMFTLDELPPRIDELDVAAPVVAAMHHTGTFHVTDDINCGDHVEVLVDGEPVQVYAAGLKEPLKGDVASTGMYAFTLSSRPFFPHVVTVRVVDYDGRSDQRSATVYVSTFVPEATLALLLVGVGVFAALMLRRRADEREPEYPHAV